MEGQGLVGGIEWVAMGQALAGAGAGARVCLFAIDAGGEGVDEEEVAIQAVAHGLDAEAGSPLEASVQGLVPAQSGGVE